jgi:hypothetical protein
MKKEKEICCKGKCGFKLYTETLNTAVACYNNVVRIKITLLNDNNSIKVNDLIFLNGGKREDLFNLLQWIAEVYNRKSIIFAPDLNPKIGQLSYEAL